MIEKEIERPDTYYSPDNVKDKKVSLTIHFVAELEDEFPENWSLEDIKDYVTKNINDYCLDYEIEEID